MSIKPMLSPNVRFQLPELSSSSSGPVNKCEFASYSAAAFYPTTTTNNSMLIPSKLALQNHSQLTSVKPPLSNSIDNHAHALHKAILDGRLTQLKYFLEMGLSANCVDRHLNKRSCLMLASITEQIDYGVKVARVLLKYGADINAQDSFGRTVLYHACTMNRIKLFEYLMNDDNSVCVDLRQKDNDGNTLLNHVCAHGTPRMVEIVGKRMTERGVECDQRNHLGYTALLLAIKNDRLQNALTLMKCCPSVSVTIRDWEKSLNAIEWLEYKISVYKGKLESESDILFRYCSNEESNDNNNNNRNSARTRTTGMSTLTPMGGRLSNSQQSNQSSLGWKQQLTTRRKASISSSIETTSRTNSCEVSKQTIQELYKTIYARMSQSSSLPFDYVLPPPSSAAHRTPTARDRRHHNNTHHHQQQHHVRMIDDEQHQYNHHQRPNIDQRALALFEQESMRQTPKLVRLREKPSSFEDEQQTAAQQSSKTLVHILFEMYDGSTRIKSKQKVAGSGVLKHQQQPRAKRASIVNIPLRERVSRGSIVSLAQRLKINSE